ncbi:hypothetical protein PMIN04_009697 [Paraphaeosphaeria minitans]
MTTETLYLPICYILLDLRDGFVTVVVGTDDECKLFVLQKGVVCKRSTYSRGSMEDQGWELRPGIVRLRNEDPDVFQVDVQSLYAGNVLKDDSDESSEDKFRTLGQLYVLADKTKHVHAKNHTVEAIYLVVPTNHDVCDNLADMIITI